jgi:hypothetical protein
MLTPEEAKELERLLRKKYYSLPTWQPTDPNWPPPFNTNPTPIGPPEWSPPDWTKIIPPDYWKPYASVPQSGGHID